jgi:hypothetical protein
VRSPTAGVATLEFVEAETNLVESKE